MRFIILILCMATIVYLYRKNLMISSSMIWIGCYLLVYFITPCVTAFPNEDIIDFIATIGLIFYIVGLSIGFFSPRVEISSIRILGLETTVDYKKARSLFCIVGVLTLVTLWCSYGFQGIYLLISGGMTTAAVIDHKETIEISNVSVNLLGWAMDFLQLPLILMFISKEKNRNFERLAFFLLYSIFFIFFGYARRMLIYPILIIVLSYMRGLSRKKQIVYGGGLFFFTVIGMISLGMFRSSGITNFTKHYEYIVFLGGLSWEELSEQFLSMTDFAGGYQYFSQFLEYGDIYIDPLVYLKPFFVFIPRFLWIEKPKSLTIQINEILNPHFASINMSSGMGIFGEAYAIMGDIGFAFYPLVWGLFTSMMDKKQMDCLHKSKPDTYFSAFYYCFSVYFIIEGHRGGMADPFMYFFWIFLVPVILFSWKVRFS